MTKVKVQYTFEVHVAGLEDAKAKRVAAAINFQEHQKATDTKMGNIEYHVFIDVVKAEIIEE